MDNTRNGYAYFRFTRFCSEVEDFSHAINKVLSQADDALFDLENGIDELTNPIGYETARIRKDTIADLKKVIDDFSKVIRARVEKKPARDRIIKRDVACRYLQRYEGETRWIQTGPDSGYPVLIDADGDIRGSVDAFDAFPKPPVESHSDIPY